MDKTHAAAPWPPARDPPWQRAAERGFISETFRYRLLSDLTPLCATFTLPDWSTSSFFSCLIGSFLCPIGKLGRLRPIFRLIVTQDNSALALAVDFCKQICIVLLFHTAKSMNLSFAWIVCPSRWDCVRSSIEKGNYARSGRAKRLSRAREEAREESNIVFWAMTIVSMWSFN